MAEVIKKVKGFVNKEGDKFELEPSAHTHTCSEILGLNDKIQEYDSDIADIQRSLGNFALKEHSHDSILDADTDSSVSISEGVLNISLDNPSTGTGGEVDITADSISNLQRAISNPDAEPTENSNALITSGAIYGALKDKISLRKTAGNERATIAVDADGEGGTIELYVTNGSGQSNDSTIDSSNIGNLNRALRDPSTTPENDDTKLITSKAVYNAIAAMAPYYISSITIESDGNGNLPISNGDRAEIDLNYFVSNTEADKLYNIIVEFYKPNIQSHLYPAIVYWTISSQDDTIVNIYVGDYHFKAVKAEGATAWEDEEFSRYKISSFLETF